MFGVRSVLITMEKYALRRLRKGSETLLLNNRKMYFHEQE